MRRKPPASGISFTLLNAIPAIIYCDSAGIGCCVTDAGRYQLPPGKNCRQPHHVGICILCSWNHRFDVVSDSVGPV
jgi:hypothetical protein